MAQGQWLASGTPDSRKSGSLHWPGWRLRPRGRGQAAPWHPGPDQAKEPEGLCKVVRQPLSGLCCRGEGAPGGPVSPLEEEPTFQPHKRVP